MKIRSAKSAQGSQSMQGVNAGKPASQGSDGAALNLGQEFKGLMESFAGGVSQSSAEVALDTFAVDPLAYAAKVAPVQPTEIQTAMQVSSGAHADPEQQHTEAKEERDSKHASQEDTVEEQSIVEQGAPEPLASHPELSDSAGKSDDQGLESATEIKTASPSESAGEPEHPLVEQGFETMAAEAPTTEKTPMANAAAPDMSAVTARDISPQLKSAVSSQELPKALPNAAPSADAASGVAGPAAASQSTSVVAVERELQATLQKVAQALGPTESAPKGQAAGIPLIPAIAAPTQVFTQSALQSSVLRSVEAGQGAGLRAAADLGTRTVTGQISPLSATMAGATGASSPSRSANSSEARTPRPLPSAVASRAFERVEQTLKEVARSKDGKTISLHLNPVELGAVKVDVTLRDGSLHARLAAENPQVAQLLRDRAHDLQGMLRKLGLDVDKITVAVHGDGQSFSQLQENLGGNEWRKSSDRNDSKLGAGVGTGAARQGIELGAVSTEKALDHWVA